MFLKVYYNVKKPVSQALHILGGEAKAYKGILLPTVATCLKKLQEISTININDVQLCLYLLHALTSDIKTRFQQCFDNFDLFKLCTASTLQTFWLPSLEENEFGFDIEVAKKRIIMKVVFVG